MVLHRVPAALVHIVDTLLVLLLTLRSLARRIACLWLGCRSSLSNCWNGHSKRNRAKNRLHGKPPKIRTEPMRALYLARSLFELTYIKCGHPELARRLFRRPINDRDFEIGDPDSKRWNLVAAMGRKQTLDECLHSLLFGWSAALQPAAARLGRHAKTASKPVAE